MATELTKSARELNDHYESIVSKGVAAALDAGEALRELRKLKYYLKLGYKDFGSYTRDRWDISQQRSSELILAVEFRAELPPTGISGKNWNEGQISEFRRIYRYRQEHMLEYSSTESKAAAIKTACRLACKILKESRSDGGPKLTAKLIRKHVDRELGVTRGGPETTAAEREAKKEEERRQDAKRKERAIPSHSRYVDESTREIDEMLVNLKHVERDSWDIFRAGDWGGAALFLESARALVRLLERSGCDKLTETERCVVRKDERYERLYRDDKPEEMRQLPK